MADPPQFDGRGGDYDWEPSGYLQAGSSYEDGYHSFDPDSPQARFDVEAFTDWEFLPDADYIVVKVNDGDDTIYVTLAGPFDDLDDLYDAIADWWETGS